MFVAPTEAEPTTTTVAVLTTPGATESGTATSAAADLITDTIVSMAATGSDSTDDPTTPHSSESLPRLQGKL